MIDIPKLQALTYRTSHVMYVILLGVSLCLILSVSSYLSKRQDGGMIHFLYSLETRI